MSTQKWIALDFYIFIARKLWFVSVFCYSCCCYLLFLFVKHFAFRTSRQASGDLEVCPHRRLYRAFLVFDLTKLLINTGISPGSRKIDKLERIKMSYQSIVGQFHLFILSPVWWKLLELRKNYKYGRLNVWQPYLRNSGGISYNYIWEYLRWSSNFTLTKTTGFIFPHCIPNFIATSKCKS